MTTRNKIAIACGTLVAIQLIPIPTDNPPVESEVPAPPAVRAVIERSCYDCHSNETRWPWYSRLAPLSWLVAYDVAEAREHMNFSAWNRYDDDKRSHLIAEVWEEVEEGEMPLAIYLPLHPDAELSPSDLATLKAWAASSGKRSGHERDSDSDGHDH